MTLVYVLGEHGDHRRRAPPTAHPYGPDAGQQNRRYDALRPKTIDAPLANDIRFDVTEEGGAKKTDAGQFQNNPNPSEESEYSDQGVSDNSDHSHGNVQPAGPRLSVLIEVIFGERRKHRVLTVVDGPTIETFR